MNVAQILEQVDIFYAKNRGAEAEKLLQDSVKQAVEEQDDGSLLQLLNELVGYYRETGQKEASFEIGEQALALAKRMGLEQTLPFATTLLNVAGAYRAGGEGGKALACYRQAEKIYRTLLEPGDMLMAGLWNNMSLAYQETNEFSRAAECLKKALSIVEGKGAAFETAVTCANLAGTCMRLGKSGEAFAYAERAARAFEGMGVEDAHYSAALSAMGAYYFEQGRYKEAGQMFQKALGIVEASLGQNEHYKRLLENIRACDRALQEAEQTAGQEAKQAAKQTAKPAEKPGFPERKGMELCREFFERYCRPLLVEKFSPYLDGITVGLAGEGSECFGYDDGLSRDHDWGAEFCIWADDSVWEQVGESLSQMYRELPFREYLAEKLGGRPSGESGLEEEASFVSTQTVWAKGRRGVMPASAFFKRLLGAESYETLDWQSVPDASLAAAVNGEIFMGGGTDFVRWREALKEGYPEEIRFLKLARSAAAFAQNAQYNYGRMKKRGDDVTADILLSEGLREAMKLQHYIEGRYAPHDKWLFRSCEETEEGRSLCAMLRELTACRKTGTEENEIPKAAGNLSKTEEVIEKIGAYLAREMYANNVISDTDSYLDAHTHELLYKGSLCTKSKEELVEAVARLEFQAFDKVKNTGGRASCQNDWTTFSIMRKSQYLTWSRTMLLQYLYDFRREFDRGHNLIEEKYGRMMESTAPEEYEQIKDHFPVLSPEKKQIIEQIVEMQVKWMEEFSAAYPCLADNARSVHTYDDSLYNTSYETYLRGELGTYSDKMLELYGRYVVEYAVSGENLTYHIMTNSARLYGYEDLEAAERFLKL